MTDFDKEHSSTGDQTSCDKCSQPTTVDNYHSYGDLLICDECHDELMYGLVNDQARSDYYAGVL